MPEALDREAPAVSTATARIRGSDEFPLALISPALATQISSTFGQLRTPRRARDGARRRGVARDRRRRPGARVERPGEVRCGAKISTDVREGVCVLPKGLWRKHTANGFTANALIPAGLADLGGQAAYNDARVQVERL